MTGPEALYHYEQAMNNAKIAVVRLAEAPASTGGSEPKYCVRNSLQCAETALKDALEHTRKLLKKDKK